jgi:hypothetical protein
MARKPGANGKTPELVGIFEVGQKEESRAYGSKATLTLAFGLG